MVRYALNFMNRSCEIWLGVHILYINLGMTCNTKSTNDKEI